MASTSERTFGARLENARKLRDVLASYPGYEPPREEESITGFSVLLDSLAALNATIVAHYSEYNTAVKRRQEVFRTDPLNVFTRGSMIRSVVIAQYGKDSIFTEQIKARVQKLRSIKITPKTAKGNPSENSISHSEQSFGSITQHFADLVENLRQFPDYKPTNPNLQIASLEALCQEIKDLNQKANITLSALRARRLERQKGYAQLQERAGRMKAYIKGNYGIQSDEFKEVGKISV